MNDLISVEGLTKHFSVRGTRSANKKSVIKAVENVTFGLGAGETLALVGETGCGKSTVARLLVGLLRPTTGRVLYNGVDLSSFSAGEMRKVRREIQMVFQDPYASLNPRRTARQLVAEAWKIHPGMVPKQERSARADQLLSRVGFPPSHGNRYPRQLSGGQRQRVGIARALAIDPRVLVFDEPVASLDVSVQAQVLNLIADLQRDLGIAYVFIAHDLAAVRYVASKVAVMYLGKIVEQGSMDEIFNSPRHPYTQALLSAVPDPEPWQTRKLVNIVLEGDVPSPTNPPSGCSFRTRCWKAAEVCSVTEPALEVRGEGSPVACHFPVPMQIYRTDAERNSP
jgi:oligopeptide transport system ATP-binding protein